MTARSAPAHAARPGVIDTTTEATFPLAAAARMYPSTRGGRTLHPATVHRWRCRGVGGVRLECLKVGGMWHTSREALQRFFERVTAAEQAGRVPPPPAPTRPGKSQPVDRAAHDARIESELDAVLGGTPPRRRPRDGDR